jgi:hypothetical protein
MLLRALLRKCESIRRALVVLCLVLVPYVVFVQQVERYKVRDRNSARKLRRKDGTLDFEAARRILISLAHFEDNVIATLALRAGILRTFAIPTTSKVLVKSKTFACAARELWK